SIVVASVAGLSVQVSSRACVAGLTSYDPMTATAAISRWRLFRDANTAYVWQPILDTSAELRKI
ncbi:MAG TPA: hypothetical protein VIX59_19185, partial [Candidatus Binataceae bacterium]